jgi:5-methylcytosine-specific restriction endonuclease McrA
MDTKLCRRCGQTKTIESFGRHKVTPKYRDGRQSWCKPCAATYFREYRARELEKVKAKEQAWAKRNPHKVLEKSHRRRNRRLGNGIYLILDRELRQLLSSPCRSCGSRQNATIDHVIPICRGGRHSIGNLQTLCGSCNSSKNDKFLVEWNRLKFARK